MENRQKYIIFAGLFLAAFSLVLLVLFFHQRSQMSEMVEAMQFEKEQLQDEYEDLAIQFDGYQGTMEVRNDSLQDLLSQEQQRVQNLLEELRITKVTNARRIAELKRELATVREVMRGYVMQIDSLNRTNQKLEAENKQYRQQYQEVSREASELKKEKKELAAVVTRASMLEILEFKCTTLNKYDKRTRIASHVVKLRFDYTIAKNVTTKTGMKNVYVRVVDPAGELMQTDSTNVFEYEKTMIGYSSAREIEYTGEMQECTQYFAPLKEALPMEKGIYNADLFADGQMIASFPFEIK